MKQLRYREIFFESHANKEMEVLPKQVKKAFVELIKELRIFGVLKYPDGRKVSGYDLYEMRVKVDGIYRCIYCYNQGRIVLLNVFRKKTRKTPIREIKKSIKRRSNLNIK